MAKKKYDAEAIEILEDLEHVRLRPSQYIGDTGIDGLHHLLKEVIDNTIDEYLDGHVTAVGVRLDTENQVAVVIDDGRGIPVTKHKKAGIPTITAIFTKLHSGGKFGKGAYTSATGGLHGVGVKATNALSEHLTVWTKRKQSVYFQQFERGEALAKVARTTKKKLKKGTVVKFKPDPLIFKGAKFDPKRVRSLLKDVAQLCPGLAIELIVDDGAPEKFFSKNGLTDMLAETCGDASQIHKTPITITTPLADIVFCWTDREGGELWRSFVNVVPTPEHGIHVQAVRAAIHTVVKGQVSRVKVRGDDLRDGLVGIIHAHVKEPEFRGQTKTRLGNKEIEAPIYAAVEAEVRKFVAANPITIKAVIDRAAALFSARLKFREQQKAIRTIKVQKGARGILPGKLCEAPDCKPTDRELYIVEGDSAFGTVKDARLTIKKGNRKVHYQEILPLRGKVLNAAKKGSLAEILKNTELSGVTQAMGTGIGPAFDIDKCRYRDVYLLMDADPDGRHITALLLAFFTKFMPGLIEANRLKVVLNPLFMGVSAKSRVYGATQAEVKKLLGNVKKFRIARFKGLGESNPKDLRAYAMEPKTRKICRVVWGGDSDAKRVLRIMGLDPSTRKEILKIIE